FDLALAGWVCHRVSSLPRIRQEMAHAHLRPPQSDLLSEVLLRGHGVRGPVGERFAPTLAAEHLASEDGLQVDAETLRRWMLAQLRPGRVGSVIDQVDQATLRTALLQPVVK